MYTSYIRFTLEYDDRVPSKLKRPEDVKEFLLKQAVVSLGLVVVEDHLAVVVFAGGRLVALRGPGLGVELLLRVVVESRYSHCVVVSFRARHHNRVAACISCRYSMYIPLRVHAR